MKKISLTFVALFFVALSFAGWTNYSSNFEGKMRTYKIYVPSSVQPNAKVVVVLHGLGGTMNDIDFSSWPAIADTANIILISPQGLPYSSILGTMDGVFNSGMVITGTPLGDIAVNADINDVGFVNALMDTAVANYNIDNNKVYVTGFSNGGFMAQRLACELSSRIAAVASISGTRSMALPACAFNPVIPVAHFHGTEDSVVRWDGFVDLGSIAAQLGIGVDSLINLWTVANQTTTSPEIDTIGNSSDALYISHSVYRNAAGESKVELFKIKGGVHDWYNYDNTNNGFDIAHEAWKFFNKNGGTTKILPTNPSASNLRIFPNPVSDLLNISGDLSSAESLMITDISGRVILESKKPTSKIDVQNLNPGIYFLMIQDKNGAKSCFKFAK